jgi:hypothetical protein
MTAEELSIRALESELQNFGCVCSRSANGLILPSLKVEVLAHSREVQPSGYGFRATVVFEARTAGAMSSGIGILAFAIGYGDTDEAAARDAAYQWVIGVFPALLSYNSPQEHSCLVERAEIVVEVPETGQRYDWIVHIPPVLCRKFGNCDFEPEVDSNEVLGAISEAVSEFAGHDLLFWLECFVARFPDGSVDATCRHNNRDWPEGEKALLAWASGWPDTEGCIVSKRQFLMFEPAPIDGLPSGGSSPRTIN